MTKPKTPEPKKRRTPAVKAISKTGRGRIDIGKGTVDILLTPEIVKSWDDEELLRGRARASDGSFKGSDPKVYPKVVHDEWRRRQFSKAQKVAVSSVERGMEILLEIAESPMAYDRDRIEAIKIIFERAMGKAPEKIEMEVSTPKWLLALQGAIVPGDDESADDVIDVQGREVS